MNQRDPVCGTVVRPTNAEASVAYGNTLYHFCSLECHGRFRANPERYVAGEAKGTESASPGPKTRVPLPWHLTE